MTAHARGIDRPSGRKHTTISISKKRNSRCVIKLTWMISIQVAYVTVFQCAVYCMIFEKILFYIPSKALQAMGVYFSFDI